MPSQILRRDFILGAAATATAGCTHTISRAIQPAAMDWTRATPPNSSAMPSLLQLLERLDTTSLVAVHRGSVIASYGDERLISYLASARKSLVSMIFGASVGRGAIDPDATLASIGFDDTGGLLPIERTATIRDLLMARSGVYHRAANLGDASDRAPPRGIRASRRLFPLQQLGLQRARRHLREAHRPRPLSGVRGRHRSAPSACRTGT